MTNRGIIDQRFILVLVLLLVLSVTSSDLQASHARYYFLGEKCSLLVSKQGVEDREERKARREKRKAERQEKKEQKKKTKEQRVKEKVIEKTRPVSDPRQPSANQQKVRMERTVAVRDKSNGTEPMSKSEGTASPRTSSRESSLNQNIERITSSSASEYTSAQAYEYTKPVTPPSSRKTSINKSKSFWRYTIGAIIIFWILSSGIKRRCGRCHKWWAMVEVGREVVDEKASTVLRENKVRDSAGNVIMTGEQRVPATVYTYHIYRRCKHEGCGYEDYLVKTKKVEN